MAYRARDIDWQCQARRERAVVALPGPIAVSGSRGRQLALEYSADALLATLTAGRSAITYRHASDAPDVHAVGLRNVPVTWLQPFLSGLWTQGSWTDGTLAGTVAVVVPATGPIAVQARLDVNGLAVATPDGLVARRAAGRLDLGYKQRGELRETDARVSLRGGQLLAGNLYVQLPATAVDAHVTVSQHGTRPMQLSQIQWRDPGVLVASAEAALGQDNAVDSLDAQLEIGSLAVARERYLTGFLAPAGFADVLLTGAVGGTVQMREGQVKRVDAKLEGVNAVDPKARFTFAGIAGKLDWTRDQTPVHGTLGWQSGALFGIGLGPERFR